MFTVGVQGQKEEDQCKAVFNVPRDPLASLMMSIARQH